MSAAAAPPAEEFVEIVLAREHAQVGSVGVEAVARARVVVQRAGRRERWRSGGVGTLERALEAWPREPFPDLLDTVERTFADLPSRVALTADQLAWFARHAPATFRRFVDDHVLVQRDACYALVRGSAGVRFAWRPAGPVRVDARPAPLFELAHAVALGRLGTLDGGAALDAEAHALVRDALLALWVHGRLPADVEWLASARALGRRGALDGARLVEDPERGPLALRLTSGARALDLDQTPPADTPAAVVRVAVAWLLESGAPTGDELFVDPTGVHARTSA